MTSVVIFLHHSIMKKYAFWIVFFYVLLFFVILPIGGQFLGERQEAVVAYYPFLVFFNGVISFLIYFLALKGRIFENPVEQQKMPFFVYSSCALVCFGSLCLSSVIFETIACFFEVVGGIQKVIFPSSFLGWSNFFFGVIFAAFFEEVIYRFYLPRAFREILGKKFSQNNQRLSVLCEGLSLLLFGLGHVYLGVLGFLNALVCGAVLRFCMIKTKSLWISFGIHAVYNFLSFLMAFLLF